MTTPSNETMKDPTKLKRFLNALKSPTISDEDYARWLEYSSSINPGSDPNNPWVRDQKSKERDI